MLALDYCGGAVSVHVGLKYKKESFDLPNQQFFVCAECGRVQKSDTNKEVLK